VGQSGALWGVMEDVQILINILIKQLIVFRN
jgi:hypothetical protein